jgi:UDP-N-acetylglucosamine--N-acetylmuramyl-(pentapeptide) pyrophosphoryl-undecaprenol N-acetylglucosamine transferase
VYPALAVLQALTGDNAGRSNRPASQVLWVGGVGGMEADLVKRSGVPFETISAAGVHGVGIRALPGNLWQLGRGYFQASHVLRRFRPDVLFFTGGYLAVPMALAGRKIPTLLYVPDIEPGMALKALARFADRIAVSTEESQNYFSHSQVKRLKVSGYPVRPELKSWHKQDACRELALDSEIPSLLVFGGSKGARSINHALLAVLPELLSEMQVVHISGRLDWEDAQATKSKLESALVERYRPYPYLHSEKMGAALAAADLVISRAGASTLGEFPLFGLPAILVPYPYAWRYQKVNAQYLENRGAAVMVEDADLAVKLLPLVRGLMQNPHKRGEMGAAMRSLAHPDAAKTIAEQLQDLAAKHNQERM